MAETTTRPTLRCLKRDLRERLPSLNHDLGALNHPLLVSLIKYHNLPDGLEELGELQQRMCLKLKARGPGWRGVGWWDNRNSKLWVVLAGERAAGKQRDFWKAVYPQAATIDPLYPTDDDYARLDGEHKMRFVNDLVEDLREAYQVAVMGVPYATILARQLHIVLYRSDLEDIEGIWIAISQQDLAHTIFANGPDQANLALYIEDALVAEAEPDSGQEWPGGAIPWPAALFYLALR